MREKEDWIEDHGIESYQVAYEPDVVSKNIVEKVHDGDLGKGMTKDEAYAGWQRGRVVMSAQDGYWYLLAPFIVRAYYAELDKRADIKALLDG